MVYELVLRIVAAAAAGLGFVDGVGAVASCGGTTTGSCHTQGFCMTIIWREHQSSEKPACFHMLWNINQLTAYVEVRSWHPKTEMWEPQWDGHVMYWRCRMRVIEKLIVRN